MRKTILLLTAVIIISGCTVKHKPTGEDYWQRIEDASALYLTGPKAQQILEQNIAGCVREIDELVYLEAVREDTPPETRNEYLRALDAAEPTAHWDSPSHLRDLRIDHTDFHDFDSCMNFKGWERVAYVRYPASQKAQRVKTELQAVRRYGPGGQDEYERLLAEKQKNFEDLN